MWTYAVRRLLFAIPILWGVFTVTFILFYLVPGDPARLIVGQRPDPDVLAVIRREWGLDPPLPPRYQKFLAGIPQKNRKKVQRLMKLQLEYAYFLRILNPIHLDKVKHVAVGPVALSIPTRLDFRFDLGRSFVSKRPVLPTILKRFPATAILGITSLTLGVLFGIVAGAISAMYHNRAIDNLLRVVSLLLVSIPFFVMAVGLQYYFGWKLGWLPISGYVNGPRGVLHLVLPALVMALYPFAGMTRLTRISVLDVVNQDYMRTAQAKGLPGAITMIRHGLRNALIPVVTSFSAGVAGVLSGAFFVETIFAWPGIGLLAVDAISNRDFPMVMGTVLFAAVLFVIADILSDLTNAWLDPRVALH